jgi:hypothetical protein
MLEIIKAPYMSALKVIAAIDFAERLLCILQHIRIMLIPEKMPAVLGCCSCAVKHMRKDRLCLVKISPFLRSYLGRVILDIIHKCIQIEREIVDCAVAWRVRL